MQKIIRIALFFILTSTLLKGQTDRIKMTNAEYPGGTAALAEYVSENLVYPETAARDKLFGKCVIKFVVDTMGNIVDVGVVKSLRGDCDTAAMNVIKTTGKWILGTMLGKKVSVHFNLPVGFNPPKNKR